MDTFLSIAPDVKLGANVKLAKFINLYGCTIGDNSKIGTFVEIQKNASIGKNCKISSHTFICEGITIGDNCFIGHAVIFVNDNHPRAVNSNGELETQKDWAHRFATTVIESHVSIGSNATILANVRIGAGAMIGAGSVVTKNIPAGEIWAGNPARLIGQRTDV